MTRASVSLPVPVSPLTRTGRLLEAICWAVRISVSGSAADPRSRSIAASESRPARNASATAESEDMVGLVHRARSILAPRWWYPSVLLCCRDEFWQRPAIVWRASDT